jgi:acyl dehydratase
MPVYFEDFAVGDQTLFGHYDVTRDEVIEFARRYGQAGLGSPGVDELRWLKPVFPGDRLTVRGTILEANPSRSKPHIGTIRTETVVTNQDGADVMRYKSFIMYLRRPQQDA